MRKEWMEPVIEVQEFVANEYVASCGDVMPEIEIYGTILIKFILIQTVTAFMMRISINI